MKRLQSLALLTAVTLIASCALAEDTALEDIDSFGDDAFEETVREDEDDEPELDDEDAFDDEDELEDDVDIQRAAVDATPEEIAAAQVWEAYVYDGVVIETANGQESVADFIASIDEVQEDWMLMLINADNPIPQSWEVGKLSTVKGGQKVAKRILPALQEMFNAARKEGVKPLVNSGYRTRKKQESLLEAKYKEFLKSGLSEPEARQQALEWVAYPGTSEHEAGLGIDIKAQSGSTQKLYDWLAANSWKYGFILRYPEDKTEITGIMNEPWHFRYVGKLAAAEMFQLNMCLEEYLEYKGLMPSNDNDGQEPLPAVEGDLLAEATEAPDALDPLIEEQ